MKALISLSYLVLTLTCVFATVAGVVGIMSGSVGIGVLMVLLFAPIGYLSFGISRNFMTNLCTPG